MAPMLSAYFFRPKSKHGAPEIDEDAEKKIDLDKVKIEIPDMPNYGTPDVNLAPPPPLQGGSDAGSGMPSADEEQKRIDELFNKK